jgi:hypothetical protein
MKLAGSRNIKAGLLSLLFISYSSFGTYAYAQTLTHPSCKSGRE